MNKLLIIIIILVLLISGFFIYQYLSAPEYQIGFPATFSGIVWNAEIWPPVVKVVSDNPRNACGDTISDPAQTVFEGTKTINDIQYIYYKGVGIGAGNLYTDYCYILSKNNKYYVVDFLIHSVSGCGNGMCGPLCGTEREEACKTFDVVKEVETPLDSIISTLKVK